MLHSIPSKLSLSHGKKYPNESSKILRTDDFKSHLPVFGSYSRKSKVTFIIRNYLGLFVSKDNFITCIRTRILILYKVSE